LLEKEKTMRSLHAIILLLFGFVLLSTGCATTESTSVWVDKTYQTTGLKRLLVIGVSPKPGVRRDFESTFASELQELGVEGMPSFLLIPDSGKLSRESVTTVIEGKNIDGVLVTQLLGIDERETYIPGSYEPYPLRHGHRRSYYGYYNSVFDTVYTPGYYVKYNVVRLETNLYETQGGAIIWSIQSETMDPQSVSKLTKSLVKEVGKKLKEGGLI